MWKPENSRGVERAASRNALETCSSVHGDTGKDEQEGVGER